jgi:hypothetical protein
MDDAPRLPPVGVPTLSGHSTSFPAPFTMPPVHHDVDPFDSNHRPGDVLVQTFLPVLDHDQKPETG